jgi:hypothetical protein
MTAIITDALKKQLLDNVYDEFDAGSTKYYIGVGRSENWDSSETVPDPTNSLRTIRNARLGLQSIKIATDASYVIPRHNWSSGTIYTAYDDSFSSYPTNSYYVLTEDNQVYICLQQGRDASGNIVTSTVQPTGSTTKPFTTGDGYVWKFLYALSGITSARFLSSNYMPVAFIGDSSGAVTLNAIQQQQAGIQEAASSGQIVGIKVSDGGTGYTSAPTVVISGDGSGAAATATVSGGSIVKIELDTSVDSGVTMGHSYQYAGISFSGGGGSGASARAIIGPSGGIGANAINDLRSSSIMFNTKPSGAEGDDFIIDQDFRQIALMRAPTNHSGSAYTDTTGKVLKSLRLTSVNDVANFVVDRTITGSTSGAKALIDEIDSDKIYAHQTEETGFLSFTEGEAVTSPGATGSLVAAGYDGDTDAFENDDVDAFSGDLLYIENRAPVIRSAEQTEDIKVIISL